MSWDEPESRLDLALEVIEQCEEVVRRYQEEHGGYGELLKKIRRALES